MGQRLVARAQIVYNFERREITSKKMKKPDFENFVYPYTKLASEQLDSYDAYIYKDARNCGNPGKHST